MLGILQVEQLGDQDIEHAVVTGELAQAGFPHQDGHDVLRGHAVGPFRPAQQVFLLLEERNTPFHPLIGQEDAREILVGLVLNRDTPGRGHLDQLVVVDLAAFRPVEQSQELRLGHGRTPALSGR